MEDNALLQEVMRSLGAGWRAVRLYPLDSPMTQQATDRVCAAIEEYVQAEPSLKLDVMRGGFVLRGLDEMLSPPGVPELAEVLGSHGIGELHFVAPPDSREVLALFDAARLRPQELEDAGGMPKVLGQHSVTSVRVVPLVLTKVEAPPEIPEEEADRFLAELAADAGRLAVWLRSLLTSDDEGLAEGIEVLASAAGDVDSFGRTMAAAFLQLETSETDRLLEASINLSQIRDVTTAMLANLSAVELTAAIRGGAYGSNVMAMSYALAHLPVGERVGELVEESVQALRAADAPDATVDLLRTMVEVRRAGTPETPLEDSRPELGAIVEAVRSGASRAQTVREQARAALRLDVEGVSTLMHLLELAEDIDAYSGVLDALARSVPRLLEAGDPMLAMQVVRGIGQLSTSANRPWPGLAAQFALATTTACDTHSMAALLRLPERDGAIEYAKELVAIGGESAAEGLAAAALDSEVEDSMEFAVAVLGRRLPELLAPQATRAEARHAAKLAELFARDASPACMQALGELVGHPEDQVRSKTARGICAAGGLALSSYVPRLLRDSSSSVALVTVSTLAACPSDQAVSLLAARLVELEEPSDVPLAREIAHALAVRPSPVATQALKQASEKGRRLGRGRHADIRRVASDALQRQQKAGA